MKKKLKVNHRFSACKGIGIFLLLVALCTLTGIVSATTYTAADQNANGQYQIVYTVNPDNSQTFKAAGVAYGTMTVSDPPSPGLTATQNVQMSGQYGYALDAAQDSSGNQADTETWLYDGSACVNQFAGVIQPGADSSTQNQFGDISVPFTGAYAGQCVYSRNASQIIADTDSEAIDGSAADVNAQATGLTPPVESSAFTGVDGGEYGCSLFQVSQWAGAFSPVSGLTAAFSSGSFGCGNTAIACQDGKIKGAETATVSTSATTTNGLSSMVSATVNGGGPPDSTGGYSSDGYYTPSSLCFDMHSSAENQTEFKSGYGVPDGSEYKVNSEADIEASGTSGSTTTLANGPNGQSADVTANFAKGSIDSYGTTGYGSRGKIDIDLSACSELNDHVTVTKVENELSNLRCYEGYVNASNSAGDSDSSVFDNCRRAGGVAGVVTNTGTGQVYASWADTWPYI